MKISTFDLRLFAAVVDHGGITAGARALNREKSTVSRELAALEERLGVRLLQRTTRSVSVTEAGEVFLAYARRVVEELENAERAIDSLSDEPRGLLRATVPYAFIRFVLAPRLQGFQDRYPELRIALDPTTRVVDLIEEGFDVAIRIGELPVSSLIARKLGTSEVVLVASKHYAKNHPLPQQLQDLKDHRLIDLSTNVSATEWQFISQDRHNMSLPVSPRMAIADPGVLLDMVVSDLGVGTIPMIYADAGIRSGALVRVLPDWSRGTRPVHAVYPSRRQLTPKVRVFLDFVAESLALLQRTDTKR
jgi:DNA-binding transcriptional LysR family regulator